MFAALLMKNPLASKFAVSLLPTTPLDSGPKEPLPLKTLLALPSKLIVAIFPSTGVPVIFA